MFGFDRRWVALAVAAAVAVGTAGCGGDDDSAADAPAAGDAAGPATTTAPGPGGEAERAKRSGDGAPAAGDGGAGGDGAQSGAGARDDSGSGTAGRRADSDSSGPLAWGKKLGDGSIQRYGKAAPADTGAQAWATVQALLEHRADGNWDDVCALLAKRNVSEIERLIGQTKELKGKSCGDVLQALTGSGPAAARRREASGLRFVEMRIDGKSGFVLFETATLPHAFVPVQLEGGQWKAGTPAANSLDF